MTLHGIDWPSIQHDSQLLRARIIWADYAERARRRLTAR